MPKSCSSSLIPDALAGDLDRHRPFFSPCLRRTFATLATENGAPTRVVQVAGGWKSLRMVERYTQALKQDAIKPFSPVDRLMKCECIEKR